MLLNNFIINQYALVHAVSYICNRKSALPIDRSSYFYCRHSTSGKVYLYLLKACMLVLNECLHRRIYVDVEAQGDKACDAKLLSPLVCLFALFTYNHGCNNGVNS